MVSKLTFNQGVVSNWKNIKPVVSKLTCKQAVVLNWKVIETVFQIGKKSQ
jgi:hypothetical protein